MANGILDNQLSNSILGLQGVTPRQRAGAKGNIYSTLSIVVQ